MQTRYRKARITGHRDHLAIINIVTYKDVVRGFLYTQRMNAEMFSIVAFLGLALSVVGIWSVVSLAVSRGTREIAVRMAVGAERVDISRLILSRALASVTLGLVLGLTLSYLLAGLVRGLLFGVEPTDPTTLAAGTAGKHFPGKKGGRRGLHGCDSSKCVKLAQCKNRYPKPF